MKKLFKVLMPTIVGATALIPTCASLSSCSKANIKVLDTFEQETGDSVASYKFVMGHVPSDKKVTVKVVNKDGTKDIDKIQLYDDTQSNSSDTITVDVDDYATFTVPAGFVLAPSQSSTSEFGLEFSYKDGDKTISETIHHLKLKYNVDYSKDLKNGDYVPQIKDTDIPSASDWTSITSTVGDLYLEYVLDNPSILQDDLAYTTSLNIKDAIDNNKIVGGLNSFKAYFNDVVKEGDGVHIHMNYEVVGKPASVFELQTTGDKYIFRNFNFSFTFETMTGYSINALEETGPSNEYRVLQIVDNSTSNDDNYLLIGRFKGTFEYSTDNGSTFTTVNYDDRIDNFSREYAQIPASYLADGMITLTYGFVWGQPTVLKNKSHFAKNSISIA